jgi:hypothetical protein
MTCLRIKLNIKNDYLGNRKIVSEEYFYISPVTDFKVKVTVSHLVRYTENRF